MDKEAEAVAMSGPVCVAALHLDHALKEGLASELPHVDCSVFQDVSGFFVT